MFIWKPNAGDESYLEHQNSVGHATKLQFLPHKWQRPAATCRFCIHFSFPFSKAKAVIVGVVMFTKTRKIKALKVPGGFSGNVIMYECGSLK